MCKTFSSKEVPSRNAVNNVVWGAICEDAIFGQAVQASLSRQSLQGIRRTPFAKIGNSSNLPPTKERYPETTAVHGRSRRI